MEKIIDYKIKDFLKLKDADKVQYYLSVLELLQPLHFIDNPTLGFLKKGPKTLPVKSARELLFGEVILLRSNFNDATVEGIFESITLVTGLNPKAVLELPITQFYGVLSNIRKDLEDLSNMEINELNDDYFDIHQEAVSAKERMSKFGILNVIDSLAGGDILKWEEIEKLPYMTVFTKLKMENEKNKIQREIAELQRKQLKK